MNGDETLAWLRLYRTDNIGPITFNKLMDRYGTASNAIYALPELAKRGGRKNPLVAYDKAKAEEELAKIKNFGAELITRLDSRYPNNLKALEDAPPVITVKGNTQLLNKPNFGFVGSRNASLNSQKLAEDFAKEIGAEGYVISSGLARGIDTSAHKGSLETGTIAVIAGGINDIYPKENTDLYHQIAEHGLIIAESPFDAKPQARHFPWRNRIISGLSLGLLVVEAGLRSGSLITAGLALDQGRELFAVPGSPLDPRSKGTNKLIKDGGAWLTTSARDVLNIINDLKREPFSEDENPFFAGNSNPDIIDNSSLSDNQAKELKNIIIDMLDLTPIEVDKIIRACDYPTPNVLTALLELELAGRIERQAGNKVNIKG